MAIPWTKWFKCILVVITCVAAEGPPLPPSQPVCYRPCDHSACTVNIHCTWDQGPDNNISSNYTLYWQSENSREKHLITGIRSNGIIPREHAPGDKTLYVWVRATNQYGDANSKQLVFNAENIIKPLPPKFSSSTDEPLEVHWKTVCAPLGLSIGPCDVQHRTEEDKAWTEFEDGFYGSYTLLDPIPGTVYEFQVRCSCDEEGFMSDWSDVFAVKSAEQAPVGQVDVWRDCGMFPTTPDCYLTWKNLAASQARGVILGYEARISYNNHTSALMNVSTIVPSSQFVFDGKIWHLSSPLTDVSSVSVSAYNTLGATFPSYLAVPFKGKEQNNQFIYLIMNGNNLTVSWDVSPQLAYNLTEYVVQYKEVGRPGGFGFDWIKVNKTNRAEFIGHFKKYTPYQISLYQIQQSGEVCHLTSVIEFSDEKPPPTVPSFKVSSVEENAVSLVWKSIPLTSQGGLVLYYQIGIDAKEVHNVSASLHHENKPIKMERLRPGQDYKVWIRAVNSAGPGPKVSAIVTTKHHSNNNALVTGVLVVSFVLFVGMCLVQVFRRKKMCPRLCRIFFEKVPDPRNSRIFLKMSQQMNEPFTCIPITGQHPKISLLEIVRKKSQDFQLDDLTGTDELDVDGCLQTGQTTEEDISVKEEREGPGGRHRKEAYSKMMDSDEDCDSSDEERSTSGYEQHFMPTEMEVLDV